MRPCLLSARGTVSSVNCLTIHLESRVALWRERYPDLHIRAVSTRGSLPQFLAGYRNDVRLAVVSADDADQLPLIVGPHERPLLPHGECSVMVVH